jgi:hypothetical protein
MEEVRKIVITSEEDAWKALQDAIRDKTDWGAVDFEFTGAARQGKRSEGG